MNTGTFTQIGADSSYKTAQAYGSLPGTGRQAATADFADVFARSLQDGSRTADARASAGKQDHGSGVKARHTEKQDTGRPDGSRMTAGQDGKPALAPTGTWRMETARQQIPRIRRRQLIPE